MTIQLREGSCFLVRKKKSEERLENQSFSNLKNNLLENLQSKNKKQISQKWLQNCITLILKKSNKKLTQNQIISKTLLLFHQTKQPSSHNEMKSPNSTQTAFKLVFSSLNIKIENHLQKTQKQKCLTENKELFYRSNNQKSVALARFLQGLTKVLRRLKNTFRIENSNSCQRNSNNNNSKRDLHLTIPI